MRSNNACMIVSRSPVGIVQFVSFSTYVRLRLTVLFEMRPFVHKRASVTSSLKLIHATYQTHRCLFQQSNGNNDAKRLRERVRNNAKWINKRNESEEVSHTRKQKELGSKRNQHSTKHTNETKTNKQTDRRPNRGTNKHPDKQTNKQTGKQGTNKPTNKE